MKYSFDGDLFFIETDVIFTDSFLTKVENGYCCYWMFSKDFFNRYRIKIPDDIMAELKNRIGDIVESRKKLEGKREEMELIKKYSSYLKNGHRPLRYQAKAVRYIVENKKILLADDVGLGKSICGILSILDLIERGEVKKVHIIVPANLRLQWIDEIRKFVDLDVFPDLIVLLNNKQNAERARMYKRMEKERGQFILVSSYDIVRRDDKRLKKYDFDMIVLDEATKIKNRATKANKIIRRLYQDVKYKLALTATPIENGLDDLYCITEFIDSRILCSKCYFMEQYCIVELKRLYGRGITIQQVIGYKNLDDARQKMRQVYIRRTVGDVELELPDVVHNTIRLEMTAKQKQMYRGIIGEIEGEAKREDILGKMVYLQEVCDSTELIDGEKSPSAKTKEIKRLLDEDLKYQKVIIITRFKKYANILNRELKNLRPFVISGNTPMDERQKIIKVFENDDSRRIIIGTEAIEYGLNLQVASVLLNADLPWNPAKLKQRMGRIYRIGSKHKKIRMINLIMNEMIEERMLEVLYKKGILFEKLFKNDMEVKIKNMLGMKKDELLRMIGEKK